MSENLQNIREGHTLHPESHGKMKSGISSKRKNPSRDENPKRCLPRRLSPLLFLQQ